MKALLATEWFKLRKTNILPFLIIGPIIVFLIGIGADMSDPEYTGMKYIYVFLIANAVYGGLLMPLMLGVLAALICRYEHQAGGWKQLFSLPTTRGKVYCAKFIVVSLVVLIMQIFVFIALFAAGLIKQYGESLPFELISRGLIGGWLASLPLIALLIWVSMLFQSLAAPFAFNVIFTIPNMMVLNSKYAPYYPWSQPFLMMNLYDDPESSGLFYASLNHLSLVLGASFLLFTISGYIYLQRKEV